MRKTFIYGLAALVLGLFASCADPLTPVVVDEKQKPQPEAPRTVSFQATLEQISDETKTALGSDLSVVWSLYDEIRVYSPSRPYGEIFKLDAAYAGQKTGTFTGPEIGEGPYYAVFPNSAVAGTPNNYNSISANHSFEAIVLPSCVYVANSFGEDSNISWAYSETLGNMSFHNVFGAVKFSLTGTKKITLINLYTRGTELLSGTLRVSNLDGTATSSMEGEQEEMTQFKQIMGMGEGVQLDATTPTDFYISVPAGALADGFFVEFIDADGKAMIKSAAGSSSNVISRSKIRKMPQFEYSPQYSDSFLGDYNDFAAYGETGKQCTYTEGESQYSFLNTEDKRTVRFQDWSDGYSLSLEISPKTLTLNSTPTVTVNAQGATGTIVSKTDASMKVIKQTVERAWLYDSEARQGYVILLED